MRSSKGQGKAAQKAAADASATAAQAAKASAGVADLQRQVAELQRRLRQPNAVQQSGGTLQVAGAASAIAGSAGAAAAVPTSAALRADIRQLQGQVARLQEQQRSGSGSGGASVGAEVTQLRQQVWCDAHPPQQSTSPHEAVPDGMERLLSTNMRHTSTLPGSNHVTCTAAMHTPDCVHSR